MSQPYVGEIRLFAGNFAPAGWMFCDGSLLPIAENETLFQLIGTTYGGDGESTFALPDLRGRVPLHQGNGFILAETGGATEITLTVSQIPAHTHTVGHGLGGTPSASPSGTLPAAGGPLLFAPPGPAAALQTAVEGASQPHENMAPFLGMNYIISLFGIFPSPT